MVPFAKPTAVYFSFAENAVIGKIPSKVHKILKAFFSVCHNNKALLSEVEQKCSNAGLQNFKGSIASLKSDGGNSYGKVFEQDGDYIKICAEAREIVEAYKNRFR